MSDIDPRAAAEDTLTVLVEANAGEFTVRESIDMAQVFATMAVADEIKGLREALADHTL